MSCATYFVNTDTYKYCYTDNAFTSSDSLELSPFTSTVLCKYKLRSVINHEGSIHGGHCKFSTSNLSIKIGVDV